IRREESRNIANLLRAHIPNVMVEEGQAGRIYLKQSPRCGKGGPPAVYLDGVLLNGDPPIKLPPGRIVMANDYPANIGEIKLTELAGVEYYANTATAPPE